jgi:hypothetical protein
MESDYTQLKQVARDYLEARHVFLTKSAAYPELKGNDNLMGRIGEMVAVQFLRSQGRTVDKHEDSNFPVTDLAVKEPGGKQRFVSVKLISAENTRGSSSALKYGWDEFILVELQANYEVKRLGWLTMEHLRSQQQEGMVAGSPITKRRMLDADGLIGLFGQVYNSANASDAPMLKALL